VKLLNCEPFDLDFDLFPKRKVENSPIRTEGLHLTDIIRSIMDDSGMLKTVSGNSWKPAQLSMAGEVGFMWEELLSSALKDRLPSRIGEIELGGITMSPDGLGVEENSLFLFEYKAVWASSRRSPMDNWKWMSQIKGYCKGLGVTLVKMYILYLNGDWKGGGPEYKGYLVEFTPLEVEENWFMLVNHAKSKGWL
jgi:hypothetical protein